MSSTALVCSSCHRQQSAEASLTNGVCHYCLLSQLSNVKKAADDFRTFIQNSVQRLQELEGTYSTSLKLLDKVVNELHVRAHSARQSVASVFKRLRQLLLKVELDFEQRLSNEQRERMKIVMEKRVSVNDTLQRLKKRRVECDEVLRKCDSDFLELLPQRAKVEGHLRKILSVGSAPVDEEWRLTTQLNCIVLCNVISQFFRSCVTNNDVSAPYLSFKTISNGPNRAPTPSTTPTPSSGQSASSPAIPNGVEKVIGSSLSLPALVTTCSQRPPFLQPSSVSVVSTTPPLSHNHTSHSSQLSPHAVSLSSSTSLLSPSSSTAPMSLLAGHLASAHVLRGSPGPPRLHPIAPSTTSLARPRSQSVPTVLTTTQSQRVSPVSMVSSRPSVLSSSSTTSNSGTAADSNTTLSSARPSCISQSESSSSRETKCVGDVQLGAQRSDLSSRVHESSTLSTLPVRVKSEPLFNTSAALTSSARTSHSPQLALTSSICRSPVRNLWPPADGGSLERSPARSDSNYDYCAVCSDGGDLLCCESCPLAYHLTCLRPPLTSVPPDEWICPVCDASATTPPGLDPSSIHVPRSWKSEWTERYLDSATVKKCYALVKRLQWHENSYPFLRPITEEEAPGYHRHIEEPMDLSTIESRLREGNYRTVEFFISDLFLMFDNCDRFNKPYSEIAGLGRYMRRFLCDQLQQMQWARFSQPAALDFVPDSLPVVTQAQATDNGQPSSVTFSHGSGDLSSPEMSASSVDVVVSVAPPTPTLTVKQEPIDEFTVQLRCVETDAVRTGIGTASQGLPEEGDTTVVFLPQHDTELSENLLGLSEPQAKRPRQ